MGFHQRQMLATQVPFVGLVSKQTFSFLISICSLKNGIWKTLDSQNFPFLLMIYNTFWQRGTKHFSVHYKNDFY